MNQLLIQLDNDNSTFRPGQPITGHIIFELTNDDTELELRLFWHTAGLGNTDIETVDTRKFSSLKNAGQESFQFIAPNGPFSFSAQLISLSWSLELVSLPSNQAVPHEIIISPTAQEIKIVSQEPDDDSNTQPDDKISKFKFS